MKRNIQYVIAIVIFLSTSLYLTFGFQFGSPALEFIKLTTIFVSTFIVLTKNISWIVNRDWRNNG